MIYTPDNTSMAGNPIRVFVNGNEVNNACFADTERGVVEFVPQPARLHKTKYEIYTRTLRGVVTVEPIK